MAQIDAIPLYQYGHIRVAIMRQVFGIYVLYLGDARWV
jgi:hypothetical protein